VAITLMETTNKSKARKVLKEVLGLQVAYQGFKAEGRLLLATKDLNRVAKVLVADMVVPQFLNMV